MKDVKVLTLSSLSRREKDIIMDIANSEIHCWRLNDNGDLELIATLEDGTL
jgi:hypothetical protein